MAGKKKKTMANKLAKMSDEERARYMQHRAEIEEEAKRRKEQLIATFMKKKVKKEEAFSRLNIAKINQNWHQILRKSKCNEMKENVQQLKKWLDRVISYKNRTIDKLLKDLEDAEDDYINNFHSHSNHLENILGKQYEYVEKLNAQYQKDLYELLIFAEKEREVIFTGAEEEQEYLKTILYRQEVNDNVVKKDVENCMQKYYEVEHEFQSKLKKMVKSQENVCIEIWQQIQEHITQYVEKTDARRLHYAELKRLDADSGAEITQNAEMIKQEEAEIQNLKKELEHLRSSQELHLSSLLKDMEDLKQQFFECRKNLQKDLQTDESKIKLLVDVSSETIKYLEGVAQKGDFIKNLAENCKKFETDREKLVNWLSVKGNLKNKEEYMEHKQKHSIFSKIIEDIQGIQLVPKEPKKEDIEPEQFGILKLKVIEPPELSPQTTSIIESFSPETSNVTSVQNITLFDKPNDESSSPFLSPLSSEESDKKSEKKSTSLVDNCLKSLEPMENFWMTYNKVEVDYLELREEKRMIEQENRQLRGMIRAVLEAEALAKSMSNSKVSTRVPSRKISACSAPLRRLIFS